MPIASLVSDATSELSSYSAPRENLNGASVELRAAVTTAATPAITRKSVAAARRVAGILMVGRGLELDDGFRCAGTGSGYDFDTADH